MTRVNLNPLRTLAGRLILVTIAAVAISHIVAFTLFANERVRSIRRVAESNIIERIVTTYDRIRRLDPIEQAASAASTGDFGLRFSIVSDGVSGPGSGEAASVARAVSTQLDDVETRASARRVQVNWPSRMRMLHDHDGPQHQPPPFDQRRAHTPPPGALMHGGPDDPDLNQREVTEMTVDVALAPGRWLRTRAYLPAPRPVSNSIWFAALASMIAVGVGAALISRQIGKPLADLANAADRLGWGALNVTAPVSGPEDVRRASTAFNAMAERLGRQMNRQRQMLWALSHDLRTPITALRLRAELVEDETQRQRLLAPLAEMETLTEQALALARAGASEEARSSVDLSEIARTLCGELQDMGVNVKAETSDAVMTECRPSEIARAMRNLAENAAKHGGGGIMKTYRGGDGSAVIEVLDDGPGLPDDVLARVTEPFFRTDTARSQSSGAGLGLAIVQAIADGHGGKLTLQNRTPHGLSAKLILPAS